MEKKTSLTGKEWWLHLMYWDPDKIKQVNLCDVWKIPFVVLIKVFAVVVLYTLFGCIFSFSAALFWVRPVTEIPNGGWRSLPYARIFGVRWGNFLTPILIFASCLCFASITGINSPKALLLVLGTFGSIISFLLIDSDSRDSEFSTLRSGSLTGYLYRKSQLVWRSVTVAFKKEYVAKGSKPQAEKVGLLKVLKLRLKSFREKVCYSIPIVRD
jgi:hypothetical protein